MIDEKRLERELKKVQREIKLNGDIFKVSRETLDEYREPTDEIKFFDVKGLFHYSTGYMQRVTQDGTDTHQKKQPMIMIDYVALQKSDTSIIIGDKINNDYEVVAIDDIGGYGIIADVTLERINDGAIQ